MLLHAEEAADKERDESLFVCIPYYIIYIGVCDRSIDHPLLYVHRSKRDSLMESLTEERIEIRDDHKQPLLIRSRINNSSQLAIVGANICPIQSLDYESVFLLLLLLFFFIYSLLFFQCI